MGDGNKPWIDCLNYRLWSTGDHLLRAQFIPNASQDRRRWDRPLENIPVLSTRALLRADPYQGGCNVISVPPASCREEKKNTSCAWRSHGREGAGPHHPTAKVPTPLSLPCLTLCLPGREALAAARLPPRQTPAVGWKTFPLCFSAWCNESCLPLRSAK